MTDSFLAAYRMLNPEQKKAVDAIEGPVMVVAGPGTGKTQILTLRIANILRSTDTPPDAILALTFTESGAHAMRRRLVDMVGSAAYRVTIGTFHGFCNGVIERYPESFPRIIGSRPVTDIDKITILEEIITNEELEHLRPFSDTFYYLAAIRSTISSLKRDNISPESLNRLVAEERVRIMESSDLVHAKGAHAGKVKGAYQTLLGKLDKTAELAIMYRRYEEELAARRLYDFEDMILEVVNTLRRDGELLLRLQEEYLYILADEHQDANNAQNELLDLLASYHESPNLFIVGDEKQAIYRFQGASLENFLYFKRRYPQALLITLRNNYRSRQGVLDAAFSLMDKTPAESGEKALRMPLIAAGRNKDTHPGPLSLVSFSTPAFEHAWVARDIKRILDEGVEPQEVAVLYRTNGDAAPIAAALERIGVPFSIESQENVLDDPDIRKLVILMRAVVHFGREEELLALMHADFLRVSPLDMYKLARHRMRHSVSYADTLSSVKELRRAGIARPAALRRLYGMLSSFATLARNAPALEALEAMMDESGYIAHILSLPCGMEKLARVNGFVDALKEAVAAHHAYTLADLVEYVTLLHKHDIAVRKDSMVLSQKRVRLMTAHRAKGLEFDYTYLIGVEDGHWGNRNSRSSFHIPAAGDSAVTGGTEADERRLFYVALTRARVDVTMTYAAQSESGRSRLPSSFVEEIMPALVSRTDGTAFERLLPPEELIAPRRSAAHSAGDVVFLREVFRDQGLSVTALNNFLKCPWQYFYRNLLRIPQAPNKHAMLGNAVHRALRDLGESARAGEMMTRERCLESFEIELRRQPLAQTDYEDALKKGSAMLGAYYERYHDSWGGEGHYEFKIGIEYRLPFADLPSVRLRGDIDRIALLDGGHVAVYDYKTGKPRSRNELEGNTKNATGDYKRQLVFYKLLLSLFENGKWRMEEGAIDFVEPDARGRFHRERFEVSDEEVRALEELIQKTARDIYDLAFWDTRCGDKACEYCALRDMMSA